MLLVDAWEDLLMYIREQRVVPIVGPELLRVKDEAGEDISLYQLVARKLAEELKVEPTTAGDDRAIYDVAERYLLGRSDRKRLYTCMNKVLEGLKVQIPEPLIKLAQIDGFRLFLTVTCDDLLSQAIRQVRAGAPVLQLAYAPNARNAVSELPAGLDLATRTVVYHLLGRRSASPEFVITEEDLLEFLYAMQDTTRRPANLFDELNKHHLLLIGTGLPDWLARFFIRIAKGKRLWEERDCKEYVVDQMIRSEPDLVLFLKSFSRETEVLVEGGAVEFVNELHRRYMESQGPDSATIGGAGDALQMDKGAVFISYASQDRPFAEQIAQALAKQNVSVWFDRNELQGGDDYDLKIRRNVANCSLFIPLISQATVNRLEGYFRKEWSWAAQRAEQIADGVPFIVPTAIDDTPEDESAKVPQRFLIPQWMRLASGQATPDYVSHINKLFRFHLSRRERALA